MKIKVYSFSSKFMGPLILSSGRQGWESPRTAVWCISLFCFLASFFRSSLGKSPSLFRKPVPDYRTQLPLTSSPAGTSHRTQSTLAVGNKNNIVANIIWVHVNMKAEAKSRAFLPQGRMTGVWFLGETVGFQARLHGQRNLARLKFIGKTQTFGFFS